MSGPRRARDAIGAGAERPPSSRRAIARAVLARRARHASPSWRPLKEALLRVLSDHGARGTLSIAFVDDAEIARVHERFLGIAGATDVLSFPLGGAGLAGPDDVFGEVVVSVETARREAARRRLVPADEAALYAIHGTLHLVGFDDHAPSRRRAMRAAERKYLRLFRSLAATGSRRGRPAS